MSKYKVGDEVLFQCYQCTINKIVYGDNGKTYYKLNGWTKVFQEHHLTKISNEPPQNEKVTIERIYYKHWRYFDELQNRLCLYLHIGNKRYAYHANAYHNGETKYQLDCLLRYKKNARKHQSQKWTPACKGGATEAILVLSNDTEITGRSECSREDNFVYEIGRREALKRAIAKFNDLTKN